MTPFLEALLNAKAEGVREERSKLRNKVTRRGKVLSLVPANGEWMAIVAAFTSKRDEPVVSLIVPIADLKGSARRKADRWARELT